jgi:FkbM family methyltransferase
MITSPVLARAMSSFIRWYFEKCPIQRGKYKLLHLARPFLVARLEEGPWLRVSGVSALEWQILYGNLKEPATATALKSLLRPGMTMLDVGANIGYYTLLAAQCVGPSGRVVAFEPTPSVVSRIKENVQFNNFAHVSVFAGAVSDREGTCAFYVNSEQDASEGNSLIQAVVDDGATQIVAPQTTLDAEIERLQLKAVHLIKIDVEGNEVKVLRGAKRILTEYAPQLLIEVNPLTLEAGGSSPAELYDELEKNGYQWRIVEEMPYRGVTASNIHAYPTARKS